MCINEDIEEVWDWVVVPFSDNIELGPKMHNDEGLISMKKSAYISVKVLLGFDMVEGLTIYASDKELNECICPMLV